jgi:hypothetical protein
MKIFQFLILATMSTMFLGCEHEIADDVCCGIYDTDELSGKWLLYESGYSPGVGYVVEEISSSPPQTIEFSDGRVETTGDIFNDIRFYKILTDTVTNTPYVALYTQAPSMQQPPESTYTFEVSNSVLKLYFRWCYEGCHLGLKRI